MIKHDLHIPISMVIETIESSFYNPLKTFLYLKFNYSGIVRIQDLDFERICNDLNFKSNKTPKKHIKDLISKNWIGYDPKCKIYFIRSFDFIRRSNSWTERSSAVFNYNHLVQTKAWCGGILYTILYKNARKKYCKAASIKGKAIQAQNTSSLFCKVATTGVIKIFNISIATASRLKSLANASGFISVKKTFSPTDIKASEKYDAIKYISDTNITVTFRIKNGKVFMQSIDKIYPYLHLSKRKKL